jgi:predicted amidohydrolase YtcJ
VTEATIFVGGRVFTGQRYVPALLVENGEVLLAGTEREVRREAPTGAEVVDLGGTLVAPGLIDAHVHVAEVTRQREGLSLAGIGSMPALAEAVRAWSSTHPTGTVIARGWDPERFVGHAWPTRAELDGLLADRPLGIVHVSGHALVVNSVALAVAGISADTADPPGGRFGRAPSGAPDGRVFESAVGLLDSRLPAPEPLAPEALRRTLEGAAEFGLTTLGAMSVGPEEAVGLRRLAADGDLPVRLRIYLRARGVAGYYRDPGGPSGPPGWFSVVGLKAFTDGAFGPRTAWLSAPYSDEPSSSGMPAATDAELGEVLATARARHLVPALHAIGDRAVARALSLLADHPLPYGHRARIEHAALTPPALWPALGEVRPALVVQPGFVWSDAWLADRLGPARVRWAYAFRTLLDRGHLIAGSSDAPYDPMDPWRGLRAAMRRTDPDGRSANPEPTEALGAEDAVRLYTTNAGAALGSPGLGGLEPGAPANLVRLGAPTLEAAIALGARSVRETWAAGRRTYVARPDPQAH